MVDSKKSSSVDAKTYYQLGNDFYEKADYEKAIENYNMAILLNPIFSEAYFNRALCYYQLKNFDKSIVDYSKAAELDPPNSIIYNNRGDAYYRKQDFKEAVKDYDKAIQLNPNYLKAFYNRGLSYASLEEYEKAIEDFSKVIQLKEDFAEAYHLRGLCFEYANNLSTAIEDYEKALKLNPDLTEAKQHLEGAKAKQAQEGTKEGEGKAGSDIKMLQKPNMSFEDVAGMIKMKEEIRDTIVYPMINPELAKHYGKLGGGGILMYGPPGCGKCVSGDTPVLLSNGDLKPISALYEEAKCNSNEKRINENETIVENPDLEVLSFNRKTAKMERKRINFVYKQRYKGKLYEIVTHSGRRIEVTPEHPFISINNGIEKIKADLLRKGTYIAIPREISTIPNQLDKKIQKLEQFNNISTPTGDMLRYISYRHPHTRAIHPIYEVNQELANFFGMVLSEGSAIHGTLFFSNSDHELIDCVANTSKNMFGITPRINPDTSEGVYKVEIGSVGLIKFLELAHGFKMQGSRNTKIPKSIMESDEEIAGAFLRAVFECESNIRTDVPEIEFTTASKEFANGISYLLLRFGIVARIKPKIIKGNDHIYWRLYISSHTNLTCFEREIGLISERKRKALEKWTKRNITGSTNVDVIPNISALLKRARESLGLSKERFYQSKNGYRYELSKNISRDYLKRIMTGKEKTEEVKKLSIIVESDVLWDEVIEVNVQEVNCNVYDLTVEDNHTFIAGFGGMVVHNTYIVKAAAGECKAGFINAKLSDLLDMYVGNTEKNIHKVFELARKNSPCILFFDEVDAIGGRRDQGEGAQYMKMAVNQMLYEMDGIEAHNENVLVIAATNAPWDVDPALRRSGRFSKAIYISEPDTTSREAIIKLHAKKRPMAKGIPFKLLAWATYGYASSDLKALVMESTDIPWKEAYLSIQAKSQQYIKQGIAQEEADQRAKTEIQPRPVTTKDFLNALGKRDSSLPPWYGQAKKQIGKQEEITMIDGKEHKKVGEPKMGPEERQQFKALLGQIEKRNKSWYKLYIKMIRVFAIGLLHLKSIF